MTKKGLWISGKIGREFNSKAHVSNFAMKKAQLLFRTNKIKILDIQYRQDLEGFFVLCECGSGRGVHA